MTPAKQVQVSQRMPLPVQGWVVAGPLCLPGQVRDAPGRGALPTEVVLNCCGAAAGRNSVGLDLLFTPTPQPGESTAYRTTDSSWKDLT
jgi:hypothetical protein